MVETLFEELKRYVAFSADDQRALRQFHPVAQPFFVAAAETFYQRILEHDGARTALVGGESSVGRLKITLVAWMEKLLTGPWDEDYYQLRCRIGRMHVRIALPQHFMFGAMNVLRGEFNDVIDRHYAAGSAELLGVRMAMGKILDLELAIMLHTYREDLLSQQSKQERLATFGQLVGSIGHELRNPLGVIETSLFIIKGRVPEDERTQKHLGRIGEQLGLANGIITNLLDMIRDRPLSVQPLVLQEIVQGAASGVPRPTGVLLEIDGVGILPKINGDPGQLRQIFVNLLENAVHASAPSGTVRVSGILREGFAEISVSDSGRGVDEATRRRLFEPLVTTKEKGLGLGLALVKRIVERHRGSIRHEKVEPHGARFVVQLPLS